MELYYYESIENGNLVTWEEMWKEAEELGYEDILDPTSVNYGYWQEHYKLTTLRV